MKSYSTPLGEVKILDVSMAAASGYGQYTVFVDIEFEGEKKTLKARSSDSSLFDALTDLDGNKTEYLLNHAGYLIERAIDDYINSL